MNELQRQVYRYLRVMSWVLTIVTVVIPVLAVAAHAASFALFPVYIADLAAVAWLHAVKWAFPYLCAYGRG